jgi:hypothetical protein
MKLDEAKTGYVQEEGDEYALQPGRESGVLCSATLL